MAASICSARESILSEMSLDLMEYLDYASFLKDWMQAARTDKKFISFRYLASKMGMDAGTLAKVIHGQRHLTMKQAALLPKILGLAPTESNFFITLVAYCRSTNGSDLQMYFERLMAIKGMEMPSLKHSQAEFFHLWHHSVIRAALSYKVPAGDFRSLAKELLPPISEDEARNSVELLTRLGMIAPAEGGAYEVTHAFITGGGEWNTKAIRNFQQQVIRLGERSLLQDPPDMRDISTLTVSIPRASLATIKNQIAEFRRGLLRQISEMDDPDCVYQLNIQLIPMTQLKGADHD